MDSIMEDVEQLPSDHHLYQDVEDSDMTETQFESQDLPCDYLDNEHPAIHQAALVSMPAQRTNHVSFSSGKKLTRPDSAGDVGLGFTFGKAQMPAMNLERKYSKETVPVITTTPQTVEISADVRGFLEPEAQLPYACGASATQTPQNQLQIEKGPTKIDRAAIGKAARLAVPKTMLIQHVQTEPLQAPQRMAKPQNTSDAELVAENLRMYNIEHVPEPDAQYPLVAQPVNGHNKQSNHDQLQLSGEAVGPEMANQAAFNVPHESPRAVKEQQPVHNRSNGQVQCVAFAKIDKDYIPEPQSSIKPRKQDQRRQVQHSSDHPTAKLPCSAENIHAPDPLRQRQDAARVIKPPKSHKATGQGRRHAARNLEPSPEDILNLFMFRCHQDKQAAEEAFLQLEVKDLELSDVKEVCEALMEQIQVGKVQMKDRDAELLRCKEKLVAFRTKIKKIEDYVQGLSNDRNALKDDADEIGRQQETLNASRSELAISMEEARASVAQTNSVKNEVFARLTNEIESLRITVRGQEIQLAIDTKLLEEQRRCNDALQEEITTFSISQQELLDLVKKQQQEASNKFEEVLAACALDKALEGLPELVRSTMGRFIGLLEEVRSKPAALEKKDLDQLSSSIKIHVSQITAAFENSTQPSTVEAITNLGSLVSDQLKSLALGIRTEQSLSSEIFELREAKSALNAQLQISQTSLNESLNDISVILTREKELNVELGKLSAELDDLRSRPAVDPPTAARLLDLESQSARFEAEVTGQRQQMEELTDHHVQELNETQQRVDALEAQLEEAHRSAKHAEIEQRTANEAATKERIEYMRQEFLVGVEHEKMELEKKHFNAVQDYQRQLRARNVTDTAVQERLQTAEDRIMTLEVEKDRCQAKGNMFVQTCEKQEIQITVMRDELRTRDERIDALKGAADELGDIREKLDRRCREKDEMIATLEAAAEVLRSDRAHALQQSREKQDKLSNFEESLGQTRLEVESQQIKIQKLQGEKAIQAEPLDTDSQGGKVLLNLNQSIRALEAQSEWQPTIEGALEVIFRMVSEAREAVTVIANPQQALDTPCAAKKLTGDPRNIAGMPLHNHRTNKSEELPHERVVTGRAKLGKLRRQIDRDRGSKPAQVSHGSQELIVQQSQVEETTISRSVLRTISRGFEVGHAGSPTKHHVHRSSSLAYVPADLETIRDQASPVGDTTALFPPTPLQCSRNPPHSSNTAARRTALSTVSTPSNPNSVSKRDSLPSATGSEENSAAPDDGKQKAAVNKFGGAEERPGILKGTRTKRGAAEAGISTGTNRMKRRVSNRERQDLGPTIGDSQSPTTGILKAKTSRKSTRAGAQDKFSSRFTEVLSSQRQN